MRPDGRRFVRRPDELPDELPHGEVYAMVHEDEIDPWLREGFVVHRREDEYLVPTLPGAPHGFLTLQDVDEHRLRLLDDELRQDVPGTDGWRWEPDDFHEETYSSPSVYLVARDDAGICRVWLRDPTPRLGFVGVRREHRGRGLGRALVAAALGEVHALGYAAVTTEIDEANTASQRLFASFGARRVGGHVELIRR